MFFFKTTRPPPYSTLFPYTTLFRSYAINKDAVAKIAFGGYATPADGVVPEGVEYAVKRSEEHTSELQSVEISYAVFCLKKKKRRQHTGPVVNLHYSSQGHVGAVSLS